MIAFVLDDDSSETVQLHVEFLARAEEGLKPNVVGPFDEAAHAFDGQTAFPGASRAWTENGDHGVDEDDGVLVFNDFGRHDADGFVHLRGGQADAIDLDHRLDQVVTEGLKGLAADGGRIDGVGDHPQDRMPHLGNAQDGHSSLRRAAPIASDVPVGHHGAVRPAAGVPMRAAAALGIAFALAWHALWVTADAWPDVVGHRTGRDYASYHYGAVVAAEGGNPYDRVALADRAATDGLRKGVHPYFYPPPFLLGLGWSPALGLPAAVERWFWLNELAFVATAAAGLVWLRQLGTVALAAWCAGMVLMSAGPNNLVMGQANFAALALSVAAFAAYARGRVTLAGMAIGTAAMLKMSPGLCVVWWLARREWRPSIAAVATAAGLSVVSLAQVDLAYQLDFYMRVLPAFGSGDYNGLQVPVTMFGNHSLPNLLAQLTGSVDTLVGPARLGTAAVALAGVAAVAELGARGGRSAEAVAAQLGAVWVAALLMPVYTYEHHLVAALPAMAVCAAAVASGRLAAPWAVALGMAASILCFDLAQLKATAEPMAGGWVLQELKTAGLVTLFAASWRAGRP